MRVTKTPNPNSIEKLDSAGAIRSNRRRGLVGRALGFLMALGLIQLSAALTQASPTIDRIEEDWKLVVSDPDSSTTAPQVTCVISSTGNLNGSHATIELNHHTQPEFEGGGVHLQVWSGETLRGYKCSSNHASLNHNGETVLWTQRVSLSDGQLTFEVLNGSSETWGDFGGQGTLRYSISTSVSSLDGYDPSVSTSNSGVGFAGNRVSSLVLKEIRYYSGNDLVQKVTPQVNVHTQ